MRAVAFCPAHVTGFFKSHTGEKRLESQGSMGAGFSIKAGVTTFVEVRPKNGQKSGHAIKLQGYETNKTDVSEFVLNEFLKMGDFGGLFFDIRHDISVPVGYGLGSSGAAALSLSFALDGALGTNLDHAEIGKIAHNAELRCKTGLGDVLASYHGGFEVRVKPGAPGVGRVEKLETDSACIVLVCFSPISTSRFIKERLAKVNGLGGEMVDRLLKTRDCEHFEDLSLEFAEYINVVTPRMRRVVEELALHKVKCGVALFGETVFTMVPKEREGMVVEILKKHGGVLVQSELDPAGARVLSN